MDIHMWLAFCVAAGIVLVIPGPTIIAVISHSLAHGRRAVVPLALGVALGDLTAMTVSLLGLGVVLAASSTLFALFKLAGAIYLICLGIRLWRSNPSARTQEAAGKSGRSLLVDLFVITSLNPKSIAFFVAFLPQFVSPSSPALPQLLILGGTFLFLGTINAGLYALFAGHLRDKIGRAGARRWFNRCGGTALIGAGVLTAALRRAA
jgi:threonine/homoserine/homoserine lactone efflux protein